MIGETQWQRGMAPFCKPFTKATVRYFDHANAAEAPQTVKRVHELYEELGREEVRTVEQFEKTKPGNR